MEKNLQNIQNQTPRKIKFPKSIENLLAENIQLIFDSYHEVNSSDEEDFYTSEPPLIANSMRNPPLPLYKTRDEFEAGYEQDYFYSCLMKIFNSETSKANRVHLKDLLKIEINKIDYKDLPNNIELPKKVFSNIKNQKSKNRFENNKSNINNFKFSSQNSKIMTISNDLNCNFKCLEPYIKNRIKYEDASNIITIINENDQKKQIKKIHFTDDSKDKKVIGKVDVQELVERAEILINPRYQSISNTIKIIIRFFTLLKRLHQRNQMKSTIYNIENKSMSEASEQSENRLIKIHNDIFSFKVLHNFFVINDYTSTVISPKERIKKEKRNHKILDKINDKIHQFEREKKEEIHNNLKEKVRNLMLNDEDSGEFIANGDSSGNSNEEEQPEPQFVPQIGFSTRRPLKEMTGKFRRRNNIRLEAFENDFGEGKTIDILPQHKSQFLSGLKHYIKKQLVQKANKKK